MRTGFFEPHQFQSVIAHLPSEIRPVIQFAHATGWRIASEVLPLEWRQVDFPAGEGRVFPMTADPRRLLQVQHDEHLRLEKDGNVVPWVFSREVAEGRGGPKKAAADRQLQQGVEGGPEAPPTSVPLFPPCGTFRVAVIALAEESARVTGVSAQLAP